jgi:histone H3/H4
MLKDAGAGRVGEDAAKEFQVYANKTIFEIAQRAVSLSKHAKRKTVNATDIKLASS